MVKRLEVSWVYKNVMYRDRLVNIIYISILYIIECTSHIFTKYPPQEIDSTQMNLSQAGTCIMPLE